MRIALAQINSTLGDFDSNAKKIIEFTKRALEKKTRLVIFPEASLFGYHPFDLLEREIHVTNQTKALKKLVKNIPKNISVLIGGFEKNQAGKGRPYFNCAFLLEKNKIKKIFRKELLPTGDVFDEARFIEKGSIKDNYVVIDGKRFLVTICEDIWAWADSNGKTVYSENPLKKLPRRKTDLVINLSASPYYVGKFNERLHMVKKTASYFKAPMVYVNLVGAQDEIIYDGQSFLIDKKGKTKFVCRSFEEDLNVFELSNLNDWNSDEGAIKETPTEQLRKGLVLGIKDFADKVGIKKVHLGLSGGIDSAVVACLAVDALGPNNVSLFALPTKFNSQISFKLAEELSLNLNCPLINFPIQKLFETLSSELSLYMKIEGFSLVHENLQSRLRGLVLMAFSNHKNSMLLTTGNKSEMATGYATLYGDMCGGLAPIGDLTKKQVYELAKFYNKEHEIIPEEIITRAPSAELRPNQKDQDSLPEYRLLDAAVVNLVEKRKPVKSKTELWLASTIYKTEFKRWQAAPILKVSAHSFGRGRRYPIAHKAKE